MSASYRLKRGLFSLCSGKWDPQSKTYVPSDVTDTMKCCLKQCTEPVPYCRNHCEKEFAEQPALVHKCLGICQDQQEQCVTTCKLNKDYWSNHPYDECVQLAGCNRSDSDCIRKSKEGVYRCCLRNCVPTRDVDCQSYCKLAQDIALDPSTLGLDTFPELDKPAPPVILHEENVWKYVGVGVGVAVILAILLLFLFR